MLPPLNFKRWIEDNRKDLKPPVGNKQVYEDGDFIIMAVGGPNTRKDYHDDPGQEFFYQIEGDMVLQTSWTAVIRVTCPSAKGKCSSCPPTSIIRRSAKPTQSALSSSASARPGERDGLLWYCERCHQPLYSEYFELTNIETQFPPVFERFYASLEHRTCRHCGAVLDRRSKPQANGKRAACSRSTCTRTWCRRTGPISQERYGYGGWVQIEHTGPGCARMVQEGKHFRNIERNCWDADEALRGLRAHRRRCAGALDRPGDVQLLGARARTRWIWPLPQRSHRRAGAAPPDALCRTGHGADAGARPGGQGARALRARARSRRHRDRLAHQRAEPRRPARGRGVEAAQELGAAVFVHPWDMLGRERMARYWLPWLVGMPAETSLSICCMIFGGVFEKLPAGCACCSLTAAAHSRRRSGASSTAFTHVRTWSRSTTAPIHARTSGASMSTRWCTIRSCMRYMLKLMGAQQHRARQRLSVSAGRRSTRGDDRIDDSSTR